MSGGLPSPTCSGHSGSMSTVHANSPIDALARLETLCLMSEIEIPLVALQRPHNYRYLLGPVVLRYLGSQLVVLGSHRYLGGAMLPQLNALLY